MRFKPDSQSYMRLTPSRALVLGVLSTTGIAACDKDISLTVSVHDRDGTRTSPVPQETLSNRSELVQNPRTEAYRRLINTELSTVRIDLQQPGCRALTTVAPAYQACPYQIAVDMESGRNTSCWLPSRWFFSVSPNMIARGDIVECSTINGASVCRINNSNDAQMQVIARAYCAFLQEAGIRRHTL